MTQYMTRDMTHMRVLSRGQFQQGTVSAGDSFSQFRVIKFIPKYFENQKKLVPTICPADEGIVPRTIDTWFPGNNLSSRARGSEEKQVNFQRVLTDMNGRKTRYQQTAMDCQKGGSMSSKGTPASSGMPPFQIHPKMFTLMCSAIVCSYTSEVRHSVTFTRPCVRASSLIVPARVMNQAVTPSDPNTVAPIIAVPIVTTMNRRDSNMLRHKRKYSSCSLRRTSALKFEQSCGTSPGLCTVDHNHL